MKECLERPPGTVLASKFRVLKCIGSGGMGTVYEVENERIGKRFALKVLHRDKHVTPDLNLRFQHEIRADGRIRNPHVVEVLDDGVLVTGEPFVVMELLEGETLAEMLERKGGLELGTMCDLVAQACDAVQAAHDAAIVHRDLKPENLFITMRDGRLFVKLLDFGIAKFSHTVGDERPTTGESTLLGTPHYMSPEQIRKLRDVDARADVYALGVILYECATGHVPFRADNWPLLGVLICEGRPEPLANVRPDLPEAFRSCVKRAMAVDRHRRHATARELAQQLRSFTGQTKPHEISKVEVSPRDPLRSTDMLESPRATPSFREPRTPFSTSIQGRKFRHTAAAMMLASITGGLITAGIVAQVLQPNPPEPPPIIRFSGALSAVAATPTTPTITSNLVDSSDSGAPAGSSDKLPPRTQPIGPKSAPQKGSPEEDIITHL